jgi:meso-butanediol dehydrogenase/(S,S)-butanediol dehydrogenase/diacetyl reductase
LPLVPDAERFAGKVAVVTGGASGIGRSIVERLVAEGAQVVTGDISQAGLSDLATELGGPCATIRCDVTSEADVEAMVAAAVKRFGGLHAMFNVAGATNPPTPLADLSEEAWDFTVDLCLKGTFFGIKHAARQMIAQASGGAIVNVASLNSRVPMFLGAAYCTAKAGVAMLSQCGALELGEYGIRVSTISPGLTDTPLVRQLLTIPGAREAYLDRIPLDRAGSPDDIAAAALFLASDDAGYVSGVNLFVDGAWRQSTYPDLRPFLARRAR